jgi:hypothetical protein
VAQPSSTNLYVNNLPKDFGEYGVSLLYAPFGPVSGLHLSAVAVCGFGLVAAAHPFGLLAADGRARICGCLSFW